MYLVIVSPRVDGNVFRSIPLDGLDGVDSVVSDTLTQDLGLEFGTKTQVPYLVPQKA